MSDGKINPAEPFTPEDVELVAKIHAAAWGLTPRASDREIARQTLAALAEAGRLLPADAETQTQWGWTSPDDQVDIVLGPMPEDDARQPCTGVVMHRQKIDWVGPWLPAPAVSPEERCTEEDPCKQCNALLRDLGEGPYDEPEEVRYAIHGTPWPAGGTDG